MDGIFIGAFGKSKVSSKVLDAFGVDSESLDNRSKKAARLIRLLDAIQEYEWTMGRDIEKFK